MLQLSGWTSEELRRAFFNAVRIAALDLVRTFRDRIPALAEVLDELKQYEDASTLLDALMRAVRRAGHRLYVLIDEYDSFANRILSDGSQDVYEAVVQRTGFVRTFYATLKSGTTSGAVARLFITGVSPLLLDDLSSGFNIGTNISQSHRFNTLVGFTRADVERALDEFLAARPAVGEQPPDQPPEAFGYRMEIPNRVIRELQWEHLAALLKAQIGLAIDTRDLDEALRTMAHEGEIEPFLGLFHERVVKAIGLKDLRRFDEKALKLMMLAFISMSRMFHPLSEKEFAQGYCDLFLGVSPLFPAARFAWLLELKYLPAGAKPAQIERAFAEAEAQVARYASDERLVPLLTRGQALRAGSLVFVAAKRVLFRLWGTSGKAAKAKTAATAAAETKRAATTRAATRAGRARAKKGKGAA